MLVSEFGYVSFLYFNIEKETSHLPHLRLSDRLGKWGATPEFRVGLAKQIPVLLSLNRLASEETLNSQT